MPSGSTVRCSLAAVLLLPTLALAAPGSPPPAAPGATARPSKQYTYEQLSGTGSVSGASFSSDEKRVLYTSNETGVFNVFSVPVTGGKPTQLTRSATDATMAVSYFPRDARFLFTRDQGGNELTHLYVRTLDGKERDLTPGGEHRATFHGWSHDGSAFYVVSNERDARAMDLYRYDARTYARTLLFRNEGYELGPVSPDGRWLALAKRHSLSDSDVYVYGVTSRELKHLTAHEGEAQWSAAAFDPASSALYMLTNGGSELTRVVRHVLASGKQEEVESAEWDVLFTAFSRSGRWRASGVNEHGRSAIRVHDARAGKPLDVPQLSRGSVADVVFSRSEKRMAFYLHGDRSSRDLHVYDFGTRTLTRLTDTLGSAVDPEDLVESEVVRFPSFDRMEIPGILYRPHQATAARKAPALVWAQGGPGGQTARGYDGFIQYLVNRGYVVLGVNNRGSSGYGKSFLAADDQKHGREPVRDLVEARKYLASLPYVDGARIGIFGASYGGYMVLAALAFHPDAFDVGVDVFGPSDWVRALKDIPPHREAMRAALYRELGNPETQAEMLRAISPAYHAQRIRKPLLVIQGANDPRVLKSQSDSIVEAVRKNGVPVEYLVLPDAGHGFGGRKNELETTERIGVFLERHLAQEPR